MHSMWAQGMAENCQKLRQKKSPRPKPWG